MIQNDKTRQSPVVSQGLPPQVAWIALSVLFQSISAALGKQAALASLNTGGWSLVLNPWYAGMLFALFLQALCWILALKRFPLSVAYPFMSTVFGLNLLWARLIFNEPVSMTQIAGIAVIMAGVAIIARKA